MTTSLERSREPGPNRSARAAQLNREGSLVSLIARVLVAGILMAPILDTQAAEPTTPVAAPAPADDIIETRMSGSFDGWNGDTVIRLVNGQIWQQSEYCYHYHYAFMPDVTIYRSGDGWKMKVKGVDRAVGVRRLQ